MHLGKRKCVFALVFAVALALGLGGTALAQLWPDLTASILGDYGITEAQVAQISDGYTDGTWKPYANMPRKQFVKMAVDAYKIPLVNPATPSYSDVPASHDYYRYVEAATTAGLTNGVGGGKFDPESTITREQAAAIIARWVAAKNGYDLATMYSAAEITEILGGFADGASVSPSLKAEMAFAVDFGIVWGDATGNLAPLKAVTRIQGAAMILRSLTIEPPEEPLVPQAVASIIEDNCAACHSPAPSGHSAGSKNQCASCHVPFTAGHNGETGCTICHATPEKTHTWLRGATGEAQLAFDPSVTNDTCIQCHTTAKSNKGKGFPDLSTETAIIAVVEKGTLRQWIQPGGMMTNYLSAADRTTLIQWVDQMSANRALPYDPYLVAKKVATGPTLDGKLDDAAWASAAEHVVKVIPTPFTSAEELKMKAVYDDTYLYISVQYADPNLSMTRGGWIRDTGAWKHPPSDKTAAWGPVKGISPDNQSEDRVAILWNMTVDTEKFFTTRGCAYKCHGYVAGSSEYTDLPGENMDSWHTKAARGLGAKSVSQTGTPTVSTADGSYEATAGEIFMNGWLDDKYLVWYLDFADGYDKEDSGRRGDAGGSAYSHNRNNAKTAPKYLETKPDNYIDGMVLTQQEIDSGEAIDADPDSAAYAGAAAVDAAWANYVAVKALVPERILKTPTGSRADVEHSASWKNGIWVHEYKRKLDTGNAADDVIFSDLKAEYQFAISLFDNCGRGEIPPGHTTYGDGQYQVLRFE